MALRALTPSPDTQLVLQLQRIDELFNAPDRDPFSSRAIDALGEAGFDVVWKRMVRRWPQRPDLQRVIVQLPPDQLTPDLAETTRTAWQRYCAAKIESNRQQRRRTTRKALRLWGYSGLILLFALALIFLFFAGPLQFLPLWLRGILSILAIYAFAVANWDALDSLPLRMGPLRARQYHVSPAQHRHPLRATARSRLSERKRQGWFGARRGRWPCCSDWSLALHRRCHPPNRPHLIAAGYGHADFRA